MGILKEAQYQVFLTKEKSSDFFYNWFYFKEEIL